MISAARLLQLFTPKGAVPMAKSQDEMIKEARQKVAELNVLVSELARSGISTEFDNQKQLSIGIVTCEVLTMKAWRPL